ncbi:hypothetical protein ZWY2020_042917 [Hordeum vulgare]|nr:hypothetical protein ZWY2020_042917 [Hordeum vulgare]
MGVAGEGDCIEADSIVASCRNQVTASSTPHGCVRASRARGAHALPGCLPAPAAPSASGRPVAVALSALRCRAWCGTAVPSGRLPDPANSTKP